MNNVVIVSGSPSATSRLDGILKHMTRELEGNGLEVRLLRVRDLPAEALLHAKFDNEAIVSANAAIAAADAVIIASPVYKASYTGILKAFLDLLPQKGLENKVALPVAIGGTLAHHLMIDYALKPLLSILGSSRIMTGMFVLETQVRWQDGELAMDEEVSARLSKTIGQLAAELAR